MSWTQDVARTVLSNGLTALVQRAPTAPVVAVVTHVKAGYFDEPDEWVGISHVLEHMYFKGTARRRPGDIARETQRVGGYINAGTIYDKTVYYTVLPSSGGGLRRALDVQADALRNSAIDPDELSRELEVIIQEAKRKLDSPPSVTYETLLQLLFKTHRIRRWRIGTEEGLRRLTRGDVVSYYESRYTPNRVTISVVGDVEVTEAMELIDHFYGDWQRPSQEFDGSPSETGPSRSDIRVLSGDVQRPRVSLGWRTVDVLHEDTPCLDVAAAVMGLGRGSHLYRYLRREGIATSTSADHYTTTDVGIFSLGLEAEEGRFDEAVTEAVARTVALRVGAMDDADLGRVRALLQTRWLRRFESMEGRASTLSEAEALGGVHLVDRFYDGLMRVTRDDVVDVAERYFDPSAACITAFVPEDSSITARSSWLEPPVAEPSPPASVPEVHVAVGSHRRSDLPEVAEGIFHARHEMSDLIVRVKRGSGLVTLGLHFAGLPTSERRGNAGISSLAARCALRGAAGLSGDELAQAVERLGGTVTPTVRVDHMGWWITVPSAHLVGAAKLLRVIAEHPNLLDDDIAVERRLLASDARRRQDDMFGYPVDRVLDRLFGDHPYAFPPVGYPESVARIDTVSVQRWARKIVTTKPVIVVVGDASPEILEDAVAPLAEWSGATTEELRVEAPKFMPRHGSEERRKQQTALAMAFPAVPFGSPDRYALTVTGAILSGLAGRLFDELRERRTLAYTVAAFPWLGRHAGSMLTYIATSPERESEARDAMLVELQRLADEAPGDGELERAKNYAAGSVEMRRQSGRSMADEVLQAWMKGNIGDVPEQANRLRTVTRDEVVQVAQRVFRAEDRAEFVVRGIAARD
jgi:zinc protease